METSKMSHDKIRWQIVKVLLDDFPSLKEKVKEYLENEASSLHRKG